MKPGKQEYEEALIKRHTAVVQEKLFAAEIAICGLGGLGSAVATALARAGVGTLHLIDFDRVELTNLNRQQYSYEELGMAKTDALEKEIERFAPYCRIVKDTVKLTEENIPEILNEDMIICEAFDKAEEKAMLTNTVLQYLPEKPLVGASGMAGYGTSNTIKTKRVMKNYYLCGDGVSGATEGNGLIAPRVMICAAHQANMIIRLILGEAEADE